MDDSESLLAFPAPRRRPSRGRLPAWCGSRPAGGTQRRHLVRGADRRRRGMPRRRGWHHRDAAGRPQPAGRARRARSLDRRGAAARRHRAAAGAAGGGERRRPGRWCSRSAAARTGRWRRSAIVASAGPAWTSAAGGRIDARLRLSFFLPHALEGGAAVDADGRADRPRRRRSPPPRPGDPGGDRRARGRGALRARLRRARLSRAGAAAVAPRQGRADRGRGRRRRAGGGRGLCRRRYRHHMAGRDPGLDARALQQYVLYWYQSSCLESPRIEPSASPSHVVTMSPTRSPAAAAGPSSATSTAISPPSPRRSGWSASPR